MTTDKSIQTSQNTLISRLLGYPLFAAGVATLVVGLGTSTYWPMALGLTAMGYGALRFTESW